MNTQKMIGTLVLLIGVLLVGCAAPVHAASATAPQVKNTCVSQDGNVLSLFNMQGATPGQEQALGTTVSCYNADSEKPRYWVVENPDGSSRSVIPTGGLSQEILEKVMDPSLGGFGR